MRLLTTEEPRPPVTIEFTADEFEQVADLFWWRAYADHPITKEILQIARERGLNEEIEPTQRYVKGQRGLVPKGDC